MVIHYCSNGGKKKSRWLAGLSLLPTNGIPRPGLQPVRYMCLDYMLATLLFDISKYSFIYFVLFIFSLHLPVAHRTGLRREAHTDAEQLARITFIRTRIALVLYL